MGRNWTHTEWLQLEQLTRRRVTRAANEGDSWHALTRAARGVLQNYSTSFFLVTRFLPAAKRRQVDVIYSAVRFPDEIVDTFPLNADERLTALREWRRAYDYALGLGDFRRAIADGISPWVAGFAHVARKNQIPPEHYHAFLDAMEADANPRDYRDLDDLIDNYIYGSATVVGYFLAYVYGPSEQWAWQRVLDASRSLGIALQLTNFLRDVAEDERRGRIYLPQDMLRAEGIARLRTNDDSQTDPLNRVLRRLSAIAEEHYSDAEKNLSAFSPDCRIAIQACIDVYRRLNLRIGSSPLGIRHRESVPVAEKFGALPPSKFWRVPLAYLGGL